MGIYIYTLTGKRDIKGTDVYKANFSLRLSMVGMDGQGTRKKRDSIITKHVNQFDTNPLFVFDFKHLEKVYKKINCNGFFYDCDDIGKHYGWLMKVGKAYEIITIDQLDQHVRSMSVFNDFADLIKSTGSHYKPTIRARDSYLNIVLADVFDDHWNETGPWINPETKEVSKGIVSYRSDPNWKPETQAYRG
jgi:hypothetical protein